MHTRDLKVAFVTWDPELYALAGVLYCRPLPTPRPQPLSRSSHNGGRKLCKQCDLLDRIMSEIVYIQFEGKMCVLLST